MKPNKQMIKVAIKFLLKMIASSDRWFLPVFVRVVLQTTSSAGNACSGKVKITAIEYTSWTIVDNAPFGRDVVRAVETESPNEALCRRVLTYTWRIEQNDEWISFCQEKL